MDHPSDAELVAAVNRGDSRAFETLYLRHRDWVVRLARRFTGNEDDALDVLQDAFAYLLRKFPGFRLTANMTTFLYPVVKHLSLDVVRRRKRAQTDDGALGDVPASDPPDTSLAGLAHVLRILPELQRETLLLRFVDDLSLEEIAQALDVPLGTVKSRLHSALKALREDPRTTEYFA